MKLLPAFIVNFPRDYVILDLETTGFSAQKHEIIEIGAIRIRENKPVDEFHSYVRPLGEIPRKIKSLTGITSDTVRDAPDIAQVAPEFVSFLGDENFILGYNIGFDMEFLFQYFQSLSFVSFFDVFPIAEAAFPSLPNHQLDTFRQALGLGSIAHSALGDCQCTWELLQRCLSPEEGDEILTISENLLHTQQKKRIYPRKLFSPKDIVPTSGNISSNHVLYGKSIVFTGDLSISRTEAAQMAVNVGALVKTSISRKTDYLVVGEQDIALVGENGMSTKEKAAAQLNSSGKGHIEVIHENDFFHLVQSGGEII